MKRFASMTVFAGALALACGSACAEPDPDGAIAARRPAEKAAKSMAAYRGLFVGVNEFDYTGSLFGCDWDAARMRDAYTTGGCCAAKNAALVVNRDATLAYVRRRFRELAAAAVAGDTVVYYQSSHGGNYADDDGNGTKDAFLCLTDDVYPDTDFADDLAQFAGGVRVVVILDACNTGGMFKSAGGTRSAGKENWEFASSVCRLLAKRRAAAAATKGSADGADFADVAWITAADWDQKAYEIGRNGEFTLALLRGWEDGSADVDGDGAVSFGELAGYAVDNVGLSTVQTSNDELLAGIAAGRAFDVASYRLLAADGVLAGFLGTCPREVVVPDGTTTIAFSAFDSDYNDVSALESVTIPSSVTVIGDYAFHGCANLKTVVFEGSQDAVDVGRDAFKETPWGTGPLPAPDNDDFDQAAIVCGETGSAAGTSDGATREDGEPEHCGSTTGSVWWTWTAPGDGVAVFDTKGSSFDTVMAVYTGVSLEALAGVCSNDDYQDRWSRCEFDVEKGTSYRVAVAGYSSTGDIVLNWSFTEVQLVPPDNDDFANAAVLAETSGSTNGCSLGATREPGEPWHYSTNAVGDSVWWTWTAPGDGVAVFDTVGSDFDTVMAVYTGTSVGALEVVCSDDDGGSAAHSSSCSFSVSAGTTYRVAVAGYSSTGDIVLNWSFTEVQLVPPDNDDFANAVVLAETSGSTNGCSLGATREPGEPWHYSTNAVGNSVWWTWTAQGTGTAVFDTVGSDFDTVMAVYTGTSVGALEVVCSDDDGGNAADSEETSPDASGNGGNSSRCSFSVSAGTTYRVAVAGYFGDGNVVLNWRFVPNPLTADPAVDPGSPSGADPDLAVDLPAASSGFRYEAFLGFSGGTPLRDDDGERFFHAEVDGDLPETLCIDRRGDDASAICLRGVPGDGDVGVHGFTVRVTDATGVSVERKFTLAVTQVFYTATFNANGGNGGAVRTFAFGAAVSAPAVTRTGYTLAGWSPAVPATMPAGNAVYVAQWTANKYAVVFDANGGKGNMAAQTMRYGTAAALKRNAFSRKGWIFLGWASKKNGAVVYKNAQSVKNLRSDCKPLTLYAVWAKQRYTVKFFACGGRGDMKPQTFTYGTAKKLSANKFKRAGFAFQGWATSASNAKKGVVKYKDKKKVANLVTTGKTVKLYAVWKKKKGSKL